MKKQASAIFTVIVGVALSSVDHAGSGTITGPTLRSFDSGYNVSGLGFQALDNSTLTGFTFQNQGAADTIVLTNSAGTISDSIATPASTPSDVVSVSWSLTTGNTYYLLQTGGVNGLYGSFGFTLPSDADIGITTTFNGGLVTIAGAIAGYDVGGYWGDYQQHHNQCCNECYPSPGSPSAFRHRPRRDGFVWLAQEA